LGTNGEHKTYAPDLAVPPIGAARTTTTLRKAGSMDLTIDSFNAAANVVTAALLAYTAREVRASKRERRFLQHQQGRNED
jgi:hypothetical protein